jgi:hypothetical protein
MCLGGGGGERGEACKCLDCPSFSYCFEAKCFLILNAMYVCVYVYIPVCCLVYVYNDNRACIYCIYLTDPCSRSTACMLLSVTKIVCFLVLFPSKQFRLFFLRISRMSSAPPSASAVIAGVLSARTAYRFENTALSCADLVRDTMPQWPGRRPLIITLSSSCLYPAAFFNPLFIVLCDHCFFCR